MDRSEMELKIVSATSSVLGPRTMEIFAYFDHYELPSYMDERGGVEVWLQSLHQYVIERRHGSRDED